MCETEYVYTKWTAKLTFHKFHLHVHKFLNFGYNLTYSSVKDWQHSEIL